jgi:hypothetical protein
MSPRHAENDARLEANRHVVRGFCATINQRRVERLGESMTDDVVGHDKLIHGEGGVLSRNG